MQATKAMEQRQDSNGYNGKGYTDLDNRYGRIGISAVAAALHHRGERRPARTAKIPYDRD